MKNLFKSRNYRTITIYILMITLAVLSGVSESDFLHNLGSMISDIFIKIFQCISMPIIALSLIVTISNYTNDNKSMTKIWQKTLFYTLGTTIIATIISCLLYLIIKPENINTVVSSPNKEAAESVSYIQHLTSLIPTNLISPFIEHQVMGVLFIGILFGIAIRYIPDVEAKKSVTQFFRGIYGIFFIITKWIIAILPLGLYGFITVTILNFRDGMDFKGIGQYLLIIVCANIIQGLLVLPLWLSMNQINPLQTMKKMLPALIVAFFSKSSAGTLPVTIQAAENRLNINPKISRFVLPLCTSINMNGCAAFIFATVMFLMQNHGIEITAAQMGIWIIIATIAAVGNAGVPMGCFFLSASLLTSMDVPIILLGLILPFYAVIDMIETSLNVWSDICVTTVIDKNERAVTLKQSTVLQVTSDN